MGTVARVRRLKFNRNGPGISLVELHPGLSWGDIAVLIIFVLIVGLILVLRPSPSESVSVSPGLGTSAPNPSGPLMVKGPLVTGKEEGLKPGGEYIYSIPQGEIPLLVNITSGRVHLVRSRPKPADLGFHAGETNLWGGFYKLFPADIKGRSTSQPEIHIEVRVGGKFLSREERPIPQGIQPVSPRQLTSLPPLRRGQFFIHRFSRV